METQIDATYVKIMSDSLCEYLVTMTQKRVKCCVKTAWNKANYQYFIDINIRVF